MLQVYPLRLFTWGQCETEQPPSKVKAAVSFHPDRVSDLSLIARSTHLDRPGQFPRAYLLALPIIPFNNQRAVGS